MLRFSYRLAAHLGIVDPVGEILGRLDLRQILTWMAYLELEPTPADRSDVRSAFLFANLMNQWKSRDAPAISVQDLLIDWEQNSEPPADYTEAVSQSEQAMQMQILSRFGR
jgi:hypothetical protein